MRPIAGAFRGMRFATPEVQTQCINVGASRSNVRTRGRAVVRLTAQLAVVVGLLCLVACEHLRRARRGRRWRTASSGTPSARTSPRRAWRRSRRRARRHRGRATSCWPSIRTRRCDSAQQVIDRLHAAGARAGAHLHDHPHAGRSSSCRLQVAPIPAGSRALYFVLAAVGIFSLLVGAGGAPPPPRQPGDAAFLLAVRSRSSACWRSRSAAGSTRSTGSSTGATSSAMLLLPPLFVHFALVFPERPDSWARSDAGRTLLPLLYLPALLLGGARVATMHARRPRTATMLTSVVALVERARAASTSALGLVAGLVDHDPRAAAASGRSPRAGSCAGSSGARRSARCRSSFGYALPFALGFTPLRGVRADGGAARPRAAGLRLGDRPLPPDGRRGDHQARRSSTPRRSRRSRRSTRSC